jgi:hypothetical protein
LRGHGMKYTRFEAILPVVDRRSDNFIPGVSGHGQCRSEFIRD